jgi:hypothetical protein
MRFITPAKLEAISAIFLTYDFRIERILMLKSTTVLHVTGAGLP